MRSVRACLLWVLETGSTVEGCTRRAAKTERH